MAGNGLYEDVGDDELVGDELVGDELVGDDEVGAPRRGRQMGRRQAPSAPQRAAMQGLAAGQQMVRKAGGGIRFQKFLGAAAQTLPAGSTQTFTLSPTVPFRGERLIVATDAAADAAITVVGFKIGNNDQMIGGGAVSIQAFRADAVGLELKCNTCPPNQNITITINNGTAAPVSVQPTLFGSSLE